MTDESVAAPRAPRPPLDAKALTAALSRVANAVACVSSREYPHVVADGTMALREVERGVAALLEALKDTRAALAPFAAIATVIQQDALAALVPALASEALAFKIPIDFGAGNASFTIAEVRRAARVLETVTDPEPVVGGDGTPQP